MDHEPCPMIYLMPTLEESQKWKAQKLNPMLQEPGRIRDLMGGLRSRDAANNQSMIDFPGGILFMGGGNSPNSYAQKTARVAIVDDFDRFPGEVGDEGDPEQLVRGRVKTFPATHKLGFISTPTIKGASLIERGYERTDMRTYRLPCPHCGHVQTLRWPNLKWEQGTGTPAWAEYECEECGRGIRENHKPGMLRDGIWIPARPEIVTRRGYQVTALTAPIGLGPSWLELAHEWIFANEQKKNGDTGPLCTFTNTQLGETWRVESSKLTAHDLERRMEDVAPRTIPVGCLALTVGIDTQDKWLAVKLFGWGAHNHWVIEYHAINGDTTLDRFWWADGAPNPPHTYSSGQWIPELDRIIWFSQRGVWTYSGAHPHDRWCQFNLSTNTWVQPGDADDVVSPNISRMACRIADGKVLASNGGTSIFQYDPAQPFASRWTTWTTNGALNWNGYGAYMHDTVGNRLLRIGDLGTARYYAIDMTTKVVTNIAPLLTGDSGVITDMNARVSQDTCGACIDPINNRIVIPTGAAGGGFFAINLATWVVTLVTPPVVGGNTVSSTPLVLGNPVGLFDRIHYNPLLKCLIYAPNGSANMCAMRLAI
jgi:hypothetical protein